MHYKALFFGLTTIDIQYFVDEFPAVNTKVKSASPETFVGGPAANAAVAFAHLNDGTHFISSIGNGPLTAFIRQDFEKTKLNFTNFSTGDAEPVIASVITSANGHRNIFTHHPEKVESGIEPIALLDQINPEIVLLDGFYPEFGIPLAKEAASRNIPVVLDCGSWKTQYTELLKYANTVICSEDFLPPLCKSASDVFSFLKEAGVDNTAISRGEKSILFEQDGRMGEVSVEHRDIIDTLGAGDFLHGAYCYYFLKFRNFEQALKAASQLASFTCTLKGTRKWLEQKNMMNFL